jgi:hypothetical protein
MEMEVEGGGGGGGGGGQAGARPALAPPQLDRLAALERICRLSSEVYHGQVRARCARHANALR